MEKGLIIKAKSGDKEAFAKLYMLYKDRLYRYAFYKLGNEYDAMDALSLCITHAFKSISTLKNENAFSAWIFKIMHFACCSVLSDRNKHSGNVSIDEISESAFCESDNSLSVEIKQALETLSDEEKEIVLLCVIAGYKSREIAQILGSKPSTVRSTLSRSLKKLRKFLGD